MLNWKTRVTNKYFWIALIPALLLFIQAALHVFGIEFDYTQIDKDLLSVVNSLFAVLAIVGIVNDPTTQGLTDGEKHNG